MKSVSHSQQCNSMHEKPKFGDPILELQNLKDQCPHLTKLPNQIYNLNAVQVLLSHDCYDIHHLFEIRKSESKTATLEVNSRIDSAFSGALPAKQAATLAKTEKSIEDEKLANQLNKWWDIETYASNYDGTGHSKEDQRAVRTLQHTTQFYGERYEAEVLWLEDVAMLAKNCYSAMGQLKSLKRRLPKDETLKKRFDETFDTDVNVGYVCKIDQTELNQTNDKQKWYLPHHLVIHPHMPNKFLRFLLYVPDLLQSLVGFAFRF